MTPDQGQTPQRPVATAAGRLADDVGPLLQADWRLDDWLKDAGLVYAVPPEIWNRRQQALIRAARAFGKVKAAEATEVD